MKKLLYLIALYSSTILYSCGGQSSGQKTAIKPDNTKDRIEIIYFHAEHRCKTCMDIEKYTELTLETYFAEQLKNKHVTFQTFNVDREENYAMSEEYEAFGSALFLNVVHDGTIKKLNLTDFAFLNISNKEKFTEALKSEINDELKNLQP